MIARDAVSMIREKEGVRPIREIDGGVHLLDVLPRLLDAPDRRLGVTENSEYAGEIDESSILEALARQISPRFDCCVIEIECRPEDYSASHVARAVEDADVHLVDLLTNPTDEGYIRVTLRVRCDDATGVVNSLERYGYTVLNVFGSNPASPTVAFERLLALQTLINV